MVVLVVFVVFGANAREQTERLRTTTRPTHNLTITITNHHNENMCHLCAVGTATTKMSPRSTGMSPCDAMQNEPARTTSISARVTHRTIVFCMLSWDIDFCATLSGEKSGA